MWQARIQVSAALRSQGHSVNNGGTTDTPAAAAGALSAGLATVLPRDERGVLSSLPCCAHTCRWLQRTGARTGKRGSRKRCGVPCRGVPQVPEQSALGERSSLRCTWRHRKTERMKRRHQY